MERVYQVRTTRELKDVNSVQLTDSVLIDTDAGSRKIRVSDLFSALVPKSAAAHNAIFRGRDLTNVYTVDEMCAMISSGTFDDLFIGDYFDKTISTSYTANEAVRFVFAGFDTYLHNGDASLEEHHAAIVPQNAFTAAAKMNSTNTTANGYYGSEMHTTALPAYASAIKSAIGAGHLIKHRDLLTSSASSTGASMAGAGYVGYSNGWAWYDTELCLLSEVQVYGSTVFSSSFYDVGCANLQLPLFALDPAAKVCKLGGTDKANASNRMWWWLKSCASASYFANVGSGGSSNGYGASAAGGVRPLFLIG